MCAGGFVMCSGKVEIHPGKVVKPTAGYVIRKVKPGTMKGKVR